MQVHVESAALDLADVRRLGDGLNRPECVIANAAGDIFSADWRGGVAHLKPDGTQALYRGELPGGRPARPNGIALRRDGSFLFADLGAESGGVFSLSRSGEIRPFLEQVDGVALPPTNFVFEDARSRVWITVSTRLVPRALGYRRDVADGFVVLVDGSGARIVCDGLGYTNEAVLDARGDWLYVNETFARLTSRFPVRHDGALGPREVFARYGPGTFPDGMAFDDQGHLWIVSIISNRVLRVAPDGDVTTVLEDLDPAHVAWVEAAYLAGELGRPHLDGVKSARLRNISSIAFGGPGRRTAYLGCLLDDAIYAFDSPVAGLAPAHWNWPER
ncbi:MAG: SMP-30/gluconolactonase/LRE family protein [Betaproteobacteria bacterium]